MMKFLALLILPAALVSAVQSDLTWSETTSLPRPSWRHACAQARNYLYFIGGGSGPEDSCDYAKINPDGTISDWLSTTPMPAALGWLTADATLDHIYLCGGWNGGGVTNAVYYAAFDSVGGIRTWNVTTSLPGNLYTQGGILVDSCLYMVGGATGVGGPTIANTRFARIAPDGTLGNWTETSALPQALRIMGLAARDSFVYSIGGRNNGGSAVNSCYFARRNPDGSLGNWTATTSLPVATDGPTCAIAYGRIYCVGGSSSNAVYSASLNPDGSISDWQTEAPLPAHRWAADGLAYGGRIYVPGGYLSEPYDDVYFSSDLSGIGAESPVPPRIVVGPVLSRNPARISFIAAGAGDYVLVVADAAGRVRLRRSLGRQAQGRHELSLPELEPGAYFCRIFSGLESAGTRVTILP